MPKYSVRPGVVCLARKTFDYEAEEKLYRGLLNLILIDRFFYFELGGFSKSLLQKALDLSIVCFRVFYLTRNIKLPGNMLPDGEQYVKNDK
jgi:hypothetical protein